MQIPISKEKTNTPHTLLGCCDPKYITYHELLMRMLLHKLCKYVHKKSNSIRSHLLVSLPIPNLSLPIAQHTRQVTQRSVCSPAVYQN